MLSDPPVRSPTLAAQAAAKLEDMITSGDITVGSRMPTEGELAARWGLSRNTIREAVRSLVHLGLLDARAGDGTYVTAASELAAALKRRAGRAPLREAIEVRLMLERQVARFAAARRTEADIENMRALLGRMEIAAQSNDATGYARADEQLHLVIAAGAGNALLADMSEHLAGALRLKDTALWNQDLAREEIAYHALLIQAIAAGDSDAAERAAITLVGVLRDELSTEFAE